MVLRQSWVAAIAVLLFAVPELSAFDYQAYQPYRLGDVVREQAATRSGDWNIVGADFRYRVSVSYSGEVRKIDTKSRQLIGMWAKAVGLDPKVAEMFTHEVKVIEAETPYWLPMQKALVGPFKSALKTRRKVNLYVTWIGSTKLDFIFLVNEFDAGPGV